MPTTDELDLLPLIMVVDGPLRGASFRLRPGGPLTMGRAEGVDILIEDGRVSRRHATVELAAGGTLLRDRESTNGTWVNDQRVSGPTPLRDGDRIRLGEVELRFFDPASAPTDPGGTLRPVPPAPARPAIGRPRRT
jgi:pSer/pThr/pTyr-binding forkhead associated (FHA) protein